MSDKNQIQTDREILVALGGATKVAELLGFDKTEGGVQRVQNWLKRGIPAKQKLEHPDLFIPGFKRERRKRREEQAIPQAS